MIILDSIKNYLKKREYRTAWRNKNLHNATTVSGDFDQNLVSVGKETYGCIQVFAANQLSHLSIGSYCSIGGGVEFILSAEHNLELFSTFPFKTLICSQGTEAMSKGDIIVDDDVWIGEHAMIMSGVHIAQGAVVAAGAVVTKDVPPYAVVGGIPARLIRYRFKQEVVEELMKVDFSSIDRGFVERELENIYRPVNNVHDVQWLPKK